MSGTFNGILPSGTNTQINYTYRSNVYQLGDGYKDVSPDGINSLIINGTLQWDNLSATQWAGTDGLLAWITANPPSVTWPGDGTALPTTVQFRITEDGIQINPSTGGVVQVQITFEQYN